MDISWALFNLYFKKKKCFKEQLSYLLTQDKHWRFSNLHSMGIAIAIAPLYAALKNYLTNG